MSSKSQNFDTSPTFRDLQPETPSAQMKTPVAQAPVAQPASYAPISKPVAYAPVAKPVAQPPVAQPKHESYLTSQLLEKTPPRSQYHTQHQRSTVTHTYTPIKTTSVTYTKITPQKVAPPKKVEIKRPVVSRNRNVLHSISTYTPGPRVKVIY